VLVEGRAWVELPGTAIGGVELSEGEVLGEATLLADGRRGADVRARGRLVALRIGRQALDELFSTYPQIGEVLFALLVRRLVANTLETSPLFAAFDPPTRAELARHFEVRRARADTVLEQNGKRSDGLYIAMSGALEAVDGTSPASPERGRNQTSPVPTGALFGHAALLSNAAASRTIKVASEAVLLRLPASKFGAFIAEFPPALAHLAELAQEPDGTSPAPPERGRNQMAL
jgi:CRP-like cAMP-binding protein